jgi:chemotaxis protein MotD
VSQLNFPDTKIDAPLPGLKPGRRESDPPVQDGGEDFDRLVAKAAEKSQGRSDSAKPSRADEGRDGSVASEPCSTADDTELASSTLDDNAPVPEAPAAPVEIAPDPVLPAALVSVLLPVADNPIKLPSADASAPQSAEGIIQIAMPNNGNVKPQRPVDPSVPNAASAPVASADIAALIAGLPQAAQQKPAERNIFIASALPLTAPAAAKAEMPIRLLPAAPAPAPQPDATQDGDAVKAGPQIEAALKPTGATRTAENSAPPSAGDPSPLDILPLGEAKDLQAQGLPLARHFARDVATTYQATADAGNPVRGAGEASATDQVSICLIRSLHEGRKTVQIHLHPSELGSIDIAMQWQGDRLTAHFVVDRPETLDLLQRDIKILEQSLGDSGFSSDNGGLSFSLRQQMENQGERRSSNSNQASEQPQNADPEIPADDPSAVRDGVFVLRV